MAKPKLTLEEFKQSITRMSGEMTSDQIQRSNDLLKSIEESLNKENTISAVQEKTLTDIKKSLGQGGNLEKSLENIKKSQEQSSKILSESLAKISNNYTPVSNIKDETPLSLKEKLKQGVAGVKKSAFAFGEKTYKIGSNILEAIGTPHVMMGKAGKSLMTGAKGTLESAKDILNTPMDYTVEGGRFAEAYSKQAQEKRELEGGSLMSKDLEKRLDERVGLTSYNRLKEKEQDLEKTKESIKKQTDYGFAPLQKDANKIEQIQKEIERVDVRNAPFERKIDQPSTKSSVQEQQQKTEDTAVAAAKALQQENPEADNVRSSQEIIADASKEDLEISKQLLETTKQSLTQLEAIRTALTEPAKKEEKKPETVVEPQPPSGGDSDLLSSAADVLGNIPGRGGKAGPTSKPKPTGKPSLGARIAGGLKSAGPGLLKGGLGAVGGMALGYGAGKLIESGHEKAGGALDVGAEALSGAGMGAMIGSVIPGVGTAIGGAIGGVAGGAYGLYKNWGNLFGGDKKKDGGGELSTKYGKEAEKIAEEALKNGTDPSDLEAAILEKLQEKYKDENIEFLESAAFSAAMKANNKKDTKGSEQKSDKFKAGGKEYSSLDELDKAVSSGEVSPSAARNAKKDFKRSKTEAKLDEGQVGAMQQAAVESPDPQLDRDIKENRARANQIPNIKPSTKPSSELNNLSVQYNDQMREAAQTKPSPAPIIMNNSTNNSTTKMVPMKADPRPGSRGSALDNYVNRISTY